MTKSAALILGLTLVAAARPVAADWNREVVDPGGEIERGSSVAWRGANPAVAFVRGTRVYYAELIAGNWMVESVDDSDCGERAALAIDPLGAPAIAYSNDGVRLASRVGGVWTTARIADGKAAALVYTPAGDPMVAYQLGESANPPNPPNYREGVFIATGGSSGWSFEEAVPTSYWTAGVSLGLDGAAEPWVGFLRLDNVNILNWGLVRGVHVAHRVGGSFVVTDVQVVRTLPQPYWMDGTSLTFDAAGQPVVAYLVGAYAPCDSSSILLGRWNGNSWSIETVTSLPLVCGSLGAPDMALEPAGSLVVAFSAGASGGIRLARQGPSTWVTETVDSAGVFDPALALDPAGRPALSYLSGGPRAVSVATHSGTGWTSEAVATSLGSIGYSPSLAMESGTVPVIGYFTGGGELRYARSTPVGWEVETVVVAPFDYHQVSLSLDATGNPRMAFWWDRQIMLARRDGTLPWIIETVVAADAFLPLSFALDPAGNPAISYLSSGSLRALQLARWNGTAWATEVVDATNQAGTPSLAFDAAGNPLIAYRDISTRILRLARFDGSSWTLEVVDDMSVDGYSSLLAVDRAGNPAIAYGDDDDRTVRLARWTGSSWTLEVVASGVPSDFVLDRDGNPAIAYWWSSELWLARQAGSAWIREPVDESYDLRASLAFDASGEPYLAYQDGSCRDSLLLAYGFGPAVVHRGVVPALDPGWQATALPLTSDNDDETAPFPLAVSSPGTADDPLPANGTALVIYRVLWEDDRPARNTLRAVKAPTGVRLEF